MDKKKRIMVIIGLIIIGLCILWMIYWIKINWPVITGEKPYGLGLGVMEVMGPLSGMILGGILVLLGIESKKLKGLFLIISGSILIGLIIYDFLVISLLMSDFSNFFLCLHFPIVMLIFGFLFFFKWSKNVLATPIVTPSTKKKIDRFEKEIMFQDHEKHSESLKEHSGTEKAQESEIKEMIHNYLKTNINRAFTTDSIMERLFSDNFTDISKELVENSLENLVKHGKIQRNQKENEVFYFF